MVITTDSGTPWARYCSTIALELYRRNNNPTWNSCYCRQVAAACDTGCCVATIADTLNMTQPIGRCRSCRSNGNVGRMPDRPTGWPIQKTHGVDPSLAKDKDRIRNHEAGSCCRQLSGKVAIKAQRQRQLQPQQNCSSRDVNNDDGAPNPCRERQEEKETTARKRNTNQKERVTLSHMAKHMSCDMLTFEMDQ